METAVEELLVGMFSLTRDIDLPIAQFLDVVGISDATLIAFSRRLSSLQLHRADLVGNQRRTRPLVVGILAQQMPAEHGKLTRHGDRSDLVTTSGSDTQKERARAWRLGGSPGRLDQHRTRVIDLTGIAFNTQTTLGYSANSSQTGGTLSIKDGALSAKIALLGNYIASSFAIGSDHHGGTLVVAEASGPSLLASPQHA